jgi:dUTP pyrophosphatase
MGEAMSEKITIEVTEEITVDVDDCCAVEGASPPPGWIDEVIAECNNPTLKVVLDHPAAQVPEYKTEGAAGCDLRAAIDGDLWLHVGQRRVISTGLRMSIREGLEGQVRGRSGLWKDQGVVVVPGTVDSDFRGVVGVQMMNLGEKPVRIAPGDRIAQLVIAPVYRVRFKQVEQLDATERGEGGFGSTGVR